MAPLRDPRTLPEAELHLHLLAGLRPVAVDAWLG